MLHTCLLAYRTVADLLARWPQVARVFVRHRLACVGTGVAPFESVAEVAVIDLVPVKRSIGELRRVNEASDDRPARAGHRRGSRRGRRP